MPLSVSNVVNVTASIAPRGLARREFGIPLFLTTDTTLGTGATRAAIFDSFDDVADVFDVGTEPYEAAQIYFQQTPFPKALIVGRWIDVDAPAIVTGGATALLATLTAISDGALTINGEDITLMDFTSAVTFADVAAVIETRLQASAEVNLLAVEVLFNPLTGGFDITTTTVGNTATLTLATAPTGLGTDVSNLAGLDSAAGAIIKQQGKTAELVEEALDALKVLQPDFYFVTIEAALNDTQTVLDVSAWVATRPYMFSAESNNEAALTPNETASIPAQLFALKPERTWWTFSRVADYKALSIVGRFSSVNFSGRNTLITGHLKELPGTLPDDITPTDANELDRKRGNYYTTFIGNGGQSQDNAYVNGWTLKDPVFIDVRYWLDWLVNAVQTDVYNLLRRTPTKVPQTEFGVSTIQSVIENVGLAGVRNGGAAAGQLSAALTADVQQTTGNLDHDGFLPKGFLVFANPIFEQNQSDRDERKSPPFRMWVKGSGAIHSVDIAILFEN